MKKLILFTIASTLSFGALAKECSTAKIPKLKGVDSTTYEENLRPVLLKNGWKPVKISEIEQESVLYNKDYPEMSCSATLCISKFSDKNKNTLTLLMGDFIKSVNVKCFKP
ncbi:hypothetical protein ACLDXX_04655 [Acinetobacter baumannii]